MATAIKAASFAAFLRIVSLKGFLNNENLLDIMQWLAVLTMLVGNLAAIRQENFKRMLAYSSIAHSGYLMVGLITAGISNEGAFGASTVIFYLFGYALMTLGAFGVVCLFERSENSSLNIEDMGGFAKSHPIMALALTVFLFSMAGLPPTLGFFGKFYMFTAAIGEGLLWLAVWGMINSVISAYYYLRPIVVMYMKDGEAKISDQSLNASQMTIVFSMIAIVILGVISNFIFRAVEGSLL
jgi:NADH-quinone oxidoreductase subunit N